MKLNRIKDILEQKGISQTWLAKQVGKTFSDFKDTSSRFERFDN